MLPWLRGAKPNYENQESDLEDKKDDESKKENVDFIIENQESDLEDGKLYFI
jgi:hypothetical protein